MQINNLQFSMALTIKLQVSTKRFELTDDVMQFVFPFAVIFLSLAACLFA